MTKRKFKELSKDVQKSIKDENASPLLIAICNNHTEVAIYLLEQGANPNVYFDDGVDTMCSAAKNNNPEIMLALYKHGYENDPAQPGGTSCSKIDPLYCAVKNNHFAAVKILIDHGYPISVENKNGYNAFYKAAEKGYLDILKYMVESAKKPEEDQENIVQESKKRCINDSRENDQQLPNEKEQVSNNNIKYIFLTDVHIFNQHGEEIKLGGDDSNC